MEPKKLNTITHWPVPERPREKLIEKGAHSLSDAELLAIFLRTGTAGKNAVTLAREILQHFGGLYRLLQADLTEFCAFPGLGNAKYAQLHASLEMCQRHALQQLEHSTTIRSAIDVVAYLQSCLSHQAEERLVFVLLDAKHRITKTHFVTEGSATFALIPTRKLAQLCLQFHAASVIVARNHPSGDPKPSQQDILCTRELQHLLRQLDIHLLGHIIIGHGRHHSLASSGQLGEQ